MRRTPDPDWFAFLRVGDVLQRGVKGSYRVVRDVSRRGQALTYVTFAIRRRSWTGRPDTTYTANDLKTFGYRYVGARVRLASELDERFRDYLRRNPSRAEGYGLTPEDVRGVA